MTRNKHDKLYYNRHREEILKRKRVVYAKKKTTRLATRKRTKTEKAIDHKITEYLKGIKTNFDKFDINKWDPKKVEKYLHVEL